MFYFINIIYALTLIIKILKIIIIIITTNLSGCKNKVVLVIPEIKNQ